MSRENVALVRAGWEAYGRGDVGWLRRHFRPDTVILQPPDVPDAKSYEGHAGIIQAIEDWPAQWEDYRLDVIELIDVDDTHVISVTRQRGRGVESGLEMDFNVAYLVTVCDGRFARVEMFFSREEALAAAPGQPSSSSG